MRGTLKYGVPIAAGLATGGYALSQGEDPGSAALAAGAGALGGGAGLLGARAVANQLAGKYAGAVQGLANQVAQKGGNALQYLGAKIPEKAKQDPSSLRMKGMRGATSAINALTGALEESVYSPAIAGRNLGKGIAAVGVPAAALTAGLGGVALGAIPGAMGLPGFQQQVVNPEAYTSLNPRGLGMTTMQYV